MTDYGDRTFDGEWRIDATQRIQATIAPRCAQGAVPAADGTSVAAGIEADTALEGTLSEPLRTAVTW